MFLMKDEEVVLRIQLRLETDGYVLMRPTMLDQTATVINSKENTAHPMSTAYALSAYNCVI